MKERLRRLARGRPWLEQALDVQERVGEINGGLVASAVTVSIFIALFPLVLVIIAIVGFVAAGDETVAPRIIEDLGLTGAAAETMTDAIDRASNSRQAASIIGLGGLAWSGSAVAVALQQAVRAPWQERSMGIKDRLLGMAWLLVAGIGFAIAVALGGVLNFLPEEVPAPLVTVAAIAVAIAIQFGLFLWMFWGLSSRRVPWRELVPGAVLAALGFETLKLIGTVWVPRLVANSSALYGSIGVVFALIAWLALFARLIVYASTLNAVRYEAEEGTDEVLIHVPKLPGRIPVAATRGGIALEVDDEPPSVPGENDPDDDPGDDLDQDRPEPTPEAAHQPA